MSCGLELSEHGRLIVWVAEWSWYAGRAHGSALFTNKHEAIRYARCQCNGNIDWDAFPSRDREYPNEDRDGTEGNRDPVFQVKWGVGTSNEGSVTVSKREVSEKFDWHATNGQPEPLSWDIPA